MKFLVPIDGSQASENALAKALTFANPLKAEIVLLTVVEPLSSYIPEVMLPTGDWVGWRGLPDIELERKILSAAKSIAKQYSWSIPKNCDRYSCSVGAVDGACQP